MSPDGKLVAGGQGSARYGAVTINTVAPDTANARIVAQRRNSGVYGLLFNADATLIAALAQDQTAQVLEVPGGKELLRVRTYEHAHLRSASLAFTPDGKYLVTASARGANLWEIRPADLVSEACVRVGRDLTPEEWQRFVPGERYRPTCFRQK